MSPDDLQLLTPIELARLARVHPKTVHKHHRAGRVHFVYLGPRSPRITLQEAERYLAGLGVTITPPNS